MIRSGLCQAINGGFDRIVGAGPGRRWSLFRCCGVLGLAVGTVAGLWLASIRGLSMTILLAVLAGAIGCWLVLVTVRAAREGQVRLICFHDQVAALLGAVAVLLLFQAPVVAYLDVTAVGLTAVIAIGRVGCMFAGCCTGRPANWGIRYGQAHVRDGLPAELAGVRLVPVQLFEAIALTFVVGFAIVLGTSPSVKQGTLLAVCVLLQAAVRFWLEFLRGDARRVLRGVSEAQWAAVAALLVFAPVAIWQDGVRGLSIVLLLGVVPAVLVVVARPRANLGAAHPLELLRIVKAAQGSSARVIAVDTSVGVRVSAQHLPGVGWHFGFSRPDRPLSWSEAVRLSQSVRRAAAGGVAILAAADPVDTISGIYHLSIGLANDLVDDPTAKSHERPTA